MSRASRHTVGRILLDVEQTPEQTPGLEAALRYWQRERLPLLLDQWLNAFAPDGTTLRLDKIELKISGLDFQQMDAEWARKVEPRLREALERALREAAPQAIAPEATAADLLLCFLQTGRLPWQADAANRELIATALRQVMAAAAPLPSSLRQLTAHDPAAQSRLIRQASEKDLAGWVEKTVGPRLGQAALRAWKRLATQARDRPADRQQFWREVLTYPALYSSEPAQIEALEALEKRLQAKVGLSESASSNPKVATPAPEKAAPGKAIQSPASDTADNDTGGWHIPNAGIVLLAPYLPRLWEQLDWTAEKQFTTPEMAWLAVQMLQFLCDGEEAQPPEYQLTLPKILCGLHPEALFDPERALNDAERAAGEALLQAVPEHAPGLGLKTIAGLRGSFLLREGMLRPSDAYWQLLVAPETHDILLERVPWNFQIVKFPWMPVPVYVDWKTGY